MNVYVAPQDFGGTDDVSIQSAFDTGQPVFFPRGEYLVSKTLQIGNGAPGVHSTKHNYRIEGVGAGTTLSETTPSQYGASLKWVGPTGGTMAVINGPIAGVNLSGIAFDCNGLAATAIRADHMMVSEWRYIVVTRYRGFAFILGSRASFTGLAQGANKNTFINVRAENPGNGGSGIRIGNESCTTGELLDVAQNVFINCDFVRDGTSPYSCSKQLSFCDNITFIETQTAAQGGSAGVGIWVKPPTGNAHFPDEIAFINSPCLNGLTTDGTWAPNRGIICDPYPTGDSEPVPSHPKIHGRTFANATF